MLTSFSLYLLVHNNEFQRSKYLSVFHEIAGRVYSVSNGVQSYLNLKTTNAGLMQRIGELEETIQGYKQAFENFSDRILPDSIRLGVAKSNYHYIPARVTNSQVFGINNFITLNKGSKDGVTEDMAVISVAGIVGVVGWVSPNFSRVIPVLNPSYHPSCMIKNTRVAGSLFWDAKDPRYVHFSGFPSHATYAIGDTIVTSGYSETFPEGVPVGVVEDTFTRKNEMDNSLKVRLFTDLSILKEVFIIYNPLREEQIKLEKGVSEK